MRTDGVEKPIISGGNNGNPGVEAFFRKVLNEGEGEKCRMQFFVGEEMEEGVERGGKRMFLRGSGG